MSSERLIFRVHAIRRMFERRITEQDVRHVLDNGEIIEDYPDDTPYPSRLILGWCGRRPLHIVVAHNADEDTTIIITAYEPDPQRWDETFRTRSAT
jgi:hypothetical protein